MISVIVATLNDERRLGGTLAALVPAAVDGLVHELIIADAGSTDATLEIADDAGAAVVGGSLAAAVAKARESWVLILDAGARLPYGWEPIARAHMRDSPSRAARIERARAKGLGGWLATSPAVGLLAPIASLDTRCATLGELARIARAVRLEVRAICEP